MSKVKETGNIKCLSECRKTGNLKCLLIYTLAVSYKHKCTNPTFTYLPKSKHIYSVTYTWIVIKFYLYCPQTIKMSINWWIDKQMWQIYTKGTNCLFTTIRMNIKSTMLSKRSLKKIVYNSTYIKFHRGDFNNNCPQCTGYVEGAYCKRTWCKFLRWGIYSIFWFWW